jgi:hypothetical protein
VQRGERAEVARHGAAPEADVHEGVAPRGLPRDPQRLLRGGRSDGAWGHVEEGRDASCRGGERRGAETLALRVPGLADADVGIDEPWEEDGVLGQAVYLAADVAGRADGEVAAGERHHLVDHAVADADPRGSERAADPYVRRDDGEGRDGHVASEMCVPFDDDNPPLFRPRFGVIADPSPLGDTPFVSVRSAA